MERACQHRSAEGPYGNAYQQQWGHMANSLLASSKTALWQCLLAIWQIVCQYHRGGPYDEACQQQWGHMANSLLASSGMPDGNACQQRQGHIARVGQHHRYYMVNIVIEGGLYGDRGLRQEYDVCNSQRFRFNLGGLGTKYFFPKAGFPKDCFFLLFLRPEVSAPLHKQMCLREIYICH